MRWTARCDDAAKGPEPQTPVVSGLLSPRYPLILTVIGSRDRLGRYVLELLDEIQERITKPTPLTWPVGIAGDFSGVLDRRTGNFIRFTASARCHRGTGGAHHAGSRRRGRRR